MKNNLIENTTVVFYTVIIGEGIAVRESRFYGGKVDKVEVTRKEEYFYKYNNKDNAVMVAEYIGGNVIKHTRTTTITEIVEELKGDKK